MDAWRNVDTSNSGTIELSKFMTSLTEVGFVEMNLLSLLKASGACHVRYEEFFHNLFDGSVDCLQPENAGSGTQSEPGPSVQKCVAQDDDCEGDAGLAAVPAGIDDAAHAAAGSGEKDPLEELHKIRDEVLHEWSAQSWANYKQVIGAFKGLYKVI